MKKRDKSSKSSQAALEFIMDYGWAIMVVLVAIAALAYFGVLSPDRFIPSKCVIEAGLGCADFRVTDNFAEVVIINSKGEDITISNINLSGCTGTASGSLKNGEQKKFRVLGCNHEISSKYSGNLNISYLSELGLQHKTKGDIITKIEQSISATKTLTFKDNGNSINDTNDAELRESDPTTNYGGELTVNVDGQSPHAHVVVQFPNIIGGGEGQLPAGTDIDSATLTVNCFNTGNPMNVYLLLEDWAESEATWNNRKSGTPWGNAGADGLTSHSSVSVVWSCPWPTTGLINYDMTSFVQSWSDGTANYGVVATDTGEDGTDWTSSEVPVVNEKPLLTITYTDYQ